MVFVHSALSLRAHHLAIATLDSRFEYLEECHLYSSEGRAHLPYSLSTYYNPYVRSQGQLDSTGDKGSKDRQFGTSIPKRLPASSTYKIEIPLPSVLGSNINDSRMSSFHCALSVRTTDMSCQFRFLPKQI